MASDEVMLKAVRAEIVGTSEPAVFRGSSLPPLKMIGVRICLRGRRCLHGDSPHAASSSRKPDHDGLAMWRKVESVRQVHDAMLKKLAWVTRNSRTTVLKEVSRLSETMTGAGDSPQNI